MPVQPLHERCQILVECVRNKIYKNRLVPVPISVPKQTHKNEIIPNIPTRLCLLFTDMLVGEDLCPHRVGSVSKVPPAGLGPGQLGGESHDVGQFRSEKGHSNMIWN